MESQLIIIFAIFHPTISMLVKECPVTSSGRMSASTRMLCNDTFLYHCLLDDKDNLTEICRPFSWMSNGDCPVFVSGANQGKGGFDVKECQKDNLRVVKCPTTTKYKSNEVFRFPSCLVKSTVTKTTTSLTTKIPKEGKVTDMANQSRTDDTEGDINHDNSVIVVIILLLILVIIGVAIVVTFMYRRKHGYLPCNIHISRDIEQGLDIEEPITEPLLHPSTKSVQAERKIVRLAAYARGKQILTENGILVITGRVGSGKSTAMNKIIELLNDDQYEKKKWKVEEALSWNKGLQYEGQVIITWDDCFGQFVTYPTKKEKTRQRIKELVRWIKVDDQNRKLVLIMRKILFKDFNVVDLLEVEEEDCKLCLDGMSNGEKLSLVTATSEFIRGSSEVKDNVWDVVKMKLHELSSEKDGSVKISSLGWPLICRLATIPYIANDFAAFIEDPFTCVQSLFNDLNSTNQNLQLYCAMISVSLKGSYSSKDPEFQRKFKEEEDKNKMHHANDIKKADIVSMLKIGDAIIQTLSSELNRDPPSAYSHYFLKTGEGDFQLFHNIFQLWLLCHFYKHFPELTIQYLDFDLSLELLRPIIHINEGYEEEIAQICGFEDKDEDAAFEDNNENKNWNFTLERNMYDLFFGRVETKDEKSLIENKQNSYLNHPLLDDSTFKTMLQVKFAVTKESNTV